MAEASGSMRAEAEELGAPAISKYIMLLQGSRSPF